MRVVEAMSGMSARSRGNELHDSATELDEHTYEAHNYQLESSSQTLVSRDATVV